MDGATFGEMLKDPAQLKVLQQEVESIMQDPTKVGEAHRLLSKMTFGMAKLRSDPEMKQFFADVEREGFNAVKKYEQDTRIMRKLAAASGMFPGLTGNATTDDAAT